MVQRLMRNSGPKLSTQYVDDPLLSEGEGEGGRGREHGHHVAIRAPIDIFFKLFLNEIHCCGLWEVGMYSPQPASSVFVCANVSFEQC